MSPTLDKGVAPSAIERVSSFKTPGTPSEKGTYVPCLDALTAQYRANTLNHAGTDRLAVVTLNCT